MIHLLEHGNADEWSEQRIALEVGETLNKHYPNHPWVVSFQGRAIVIRHLAIADAVARLVGKQGFSAALPPQATRGATPRDIAHKAMIFGGQMLEAFGLPRGAWDGREPVMPNWGKGQESKGFT